MASGSTRAARLALLGEVLRILRQRRRPVRSILIHPDSTIEVTLVTDSDLRRGSSDDDFLAQVEIARWLDTFEQD